MSEQPQQIQVHCPYMRNVIFNGQPISGCFATRQIINGQSIHDYCLGSKCPMPIHTTNGEKV